jgi:hypothetical protein
MEPTRQAPAVPAPTPVATETRSGAATLTATGTVEEVRADQVVVSRQGSPALRLKLTNDVPVQSGDQAGSLDDLKVGAPVRVQYHLEANQPVVERIDITAPPSESGGVR